MKPVLEYLYIWYIKGKGKHNCSFEPHLPEALQHVSNKQEAISLEKFM